LLGRKLKALIQNEFVECTETKGNKSYKLTPKGLEVAAEMKQQLKADVSTPPSSAMESPPFRSIRASLLRPTVVLRKQLASD
jgi:DNA-binding PadR family transcriptional regulator